MVHVASGGNPIHGLLYVYFMNATITTPGDTWFTEILHSSRGFETSMIILLLAENHLSEVTDPI